jgi:hypothetical protein
MTRWRAFVARCLVGVPLSALLFASALPELTNFELTP